MAQKGAFPMTNEEMIKVLQQTMQESMQELKQDIRQEMQQSLEAEREYTSRMMDSKLEPINQRLDGIEGRMTRLEVSYENNTEKILNLLREDYSRVATAAAKTGDYDEVKSMVKDHNKALVNHNQRITDLEKKAI